MIARGVGVVAQAMDTEEYSRSCRGTHTVGACHEVDDGTHIPLRLTLLVAMRPRVQGTARVSVPAQMQGCCGHVECEMLTVVTPRSKILNCS